MSEIKYTPIIDGNKSLFYYKRNILSDQEYSLLKSWLDEQEYRDGNCISGKEIPRQQLWFQNFNSTSWK